MKYFSMFSGIGGFEYGINQSIEGAECVGYSEVNRYATSIYRLHYPHHKNYGDATRINTTELPDFDLLVGGFPCQAFSVAGEKRGFEDSRGTLFFEIARVLRDKRPRHFLLENVRGLLGHDGGKTFQTMLGVLSDIGYVVQWQVLNSKDLGVPQNRERIFITGYLRGSGGRQILPIRTCDSVHYKEPAQDNFANCLDSNYWKGWRDHGQRTMIHNVYGGFKEGVREYKEYSPTIRTASGGGHLPMVKEGDRIRRLTPVECERLQGFPDNWTRVGHDLRVVSDTQRYTCLGNAVTTNVISRIMENYNG